MFLALTGRTEANIANRAEAAVFAGTVTKPVDSDQPARAIVESFSSER